MFGRTPEEAATVVRVICEYQAYVENHLNQIVTAVFFGNLDEQHRTGHARDSSRRRRSTHDRGTAQQIGLAGRRAAVGCRLRRVPGNHAAAALDGEA